MTTPTATTKPVTIAIADDEKNTRIEISGETRAAVYRDAARALRDARERITTAFDRLDVLDEHDHARDALEELAVALDEAKAPTDVLWYLAPRED